MPQSHLCFQFRSSVFWDPDAWNPVTCLVFLFCFFAYLHQVYLTSVNHQWKHELGRAAQWNAVALRCAPPRASAPPIFVQRCLILGWSCKRHRLITVWIVLYWLRIDLYLDALDHLGLCVLKSFWNFLIVGCKTCLCNRFCIDQTRTILTFIHDCSGFKCKILGLFEVTRRQKVQAKGVFIKRKCNYLQYCTQYVAMSFYAHWHSVQKLLKKIKNVNSS